MKEFSLPRTGRSNVVFNGDVIASAKSPANQRHLNNPASNNMWFECEVYRTLKGRLIVAIAYRWAGKLNRENAQDIVEVFESIDLVLGYLETFDAQACVTGYPPGANWAEKQSALMVSIKEDFDLLIERVEDQLAKLGEPERIE